MALDIIFLSYDEPNADANFERLQSRFPYTKRVHGVQGIANAHAKAAKESDTRLFYVIDGDTEVFDTFRFESQNKEKHLCAFSNFWHLLKHWSLSICLEKIWN